MAEEQNNALAIFSGLGSELGKELGAQIEVARELAAGVPIVLWGSLLDYTAERCREILHAHGRDDVKVERGRVIGSSKPSIRFTHPMVHGGLVLSLGTQDDELDALGDVVAALIDAGRLT